MEFDLENPFTNLPDVHFQTLPSLFHIESDHMPPLTFFKSLKALDFHFSLRRQAISSILQVSCTFDPFLSYLAVNYLDRFLSSQGMPQPKPGVLRLVAVSCVSLAAKMRKTEFSFTDIQCDGGFIFDAETVERMEVLILGALKWRMRSVTPFSFVSFFISLFNLHDPPLSQALKARANEIIFKAQNDIKFIAFKPSIIAASALLYASHELFPLKFSCFMNTISNCSYVNKERMLQCYNELQEMMTMEVYELVSDTCTGSDSLVNVLEPAFSKLR